MLESHWPLFRNFRARFRTGAMILKDLTTGRDLRVPTILGLAMVVTFLLVIYHGSEILAAILSVQFVAMVLWFLTPAILQYLIVIVATVAWLAPALIVNERISEHSRLLYCVVAVIWGAWLCSPIFIRSWGWRIPFWTGVLGFAAYIVR